MCNPPVSTVVQISVVSCKKVKFTYRYYSRFQPEKNLDRRNVNIRCSFFNRDVVVVFVWLVHGRFAYDILALIFTRQNNNYVGLSFDQRQAQWRIDLFWQQLQALSARSCRSLARNLHSSGCTQSTCSQGGGPCEGFKKRWRTTTTSDRGV